MLIADSSVRNASTAASMVACGLSRERRRVAVEGKGRDQTVTTTRAARLPSDTDASLSAAAVAGRPRGTLAKMIAVRTVVAMTKPAPISANEIANPR